MPDTGKQSQAQKASPTPELPALPTKIRMLRLHGFIEETGRHRQWHAGDTIIDPTEIKLLTDRGAVFEAI